LAGTEKVKRKVGYCVVFIRKKVWLNRVPLEGGKKRRRRETQKTSPGVLGRLTGSVLAVPYTFLTYLGGLRYKGHRIGDYRSAKRYGDRAGV